jgi:hypothetical protein
MSFRVALAFLLLACACKRSAPRPDPADAGAPAAAALSERYVSPSKHFAVRYPRDFAASHAGQRSMLLVKNLTEDGDVVMMTFVAVENPISNDLGEFSRVLLDAQGKELNAYVETERRPGTCLGVPGIETTASWKSRAAGAKPSARYSCTFLKAGHGYSFGWDVPPARAAAYEPLLKRILEATEFLD